MESSFIRTEILLGREAVEKLKNKKVIVFGVGGVGGYVCEVLARTGVGAIDLVDNDTVNESNINRQIIATRKTIGKYKVDVMAERINDINPGCRVKTHRMFFLPENSHEFDFREYDYVVDAVDTVTAKIQIIAACNEAGTPVLSSMGAGNKLDPTKFQVADIYKTSVDPLARVMRRELKKRGIRKLKVVFSTELPVIPKKNVEKTPEEQEYHASSESASGAFKKAVPGSVAFVPSVAGMIIGGEVIKDLIKDW
ncbi:MAG: tRNA threonylcarbamoyladenosine dehydratase [Oribacterium sp.]|nr:tRNA threonylcarbamoyladenosine dehydratase [Oribacterium sp.]